ncbi:Iron-sulfur cluster regulator IscR [Salmonella enterica subsp. enterica]|uniref:Iron-sulfur cluster regulator IscR n=1 Tax=Salmonella enterica I TaxID=59201 RepID=A0A379W5I5_SALET|nr:Iron-sulfur cluster regulator IscR [Salmonella enterica subsp. enterica]
MRLTSKGRYAVTAMLDVALNSEAGPVPLADISERQGISLSYLEQLFSRLRKNGLVSSVRGRAAVICWVKMLAVSRSAK